MQGLQKGRTRCNFFLCMKRIQSIAILPTFRFAGRIEWSCVSEPLCEYSFASVPSEGMVSREDLFLDLLSILSDSADVKRMIVISFNEEYGKKVTDALHEVKGKEVIQFRMNEPELPVDYKWDMLAFPVMQALGIKAEELQ